MERFKILGILLILILLTVSCFKLESYPPVPAIEYIGFKIIDSTDILENPVLYGELHFSFVDGDGDLGFYQPAGVEEEDIAKTVFITPFIKTNGVFVQDTPIVPLNFRIPYFETGGNNKTLKGEIIVRDINYYPPFNGDTLKYQFYIVDRAGNKSNVEETDVMIIE